MGIIADKFAAVLADMKRQDEESRRKTQETISRAKRLIAQLEEQERQWRLEDEMI